MKKPPKGGESSVVIINGIKLFLLSIQTENEKWQQRVQQPERKTLRNTSLAMRKKALFYALIATW